MDTKYSTDRLHQSKPNYIGVDGSEIRPEMRCGSGGGSPAKQYDPEYNQTCVADPYAQKTEQPSSAHLFGFEASIWSLVETATQVANRLQETEARIFGVRPEATNGSQPVSEPQGALERLDLALYNLHSELNRIEILSDKLAELI